MTWLNGPARVRERRRPRGAYRAPPRVADGEPSGACLCSAASVRHIATCAAIADRPVRVAWARPAVHRRAVFGHRPAPLRGAASHEAEGRRGARAGRVRGAPRGTCACLRQITKWAGYLTQRLTLSVDCLDAPVVGTRREPHGVTSGTQDHLLAVQIIGSHAALMTADHLERLDSRFGSTPVADLFGYGRRFGLPSDVDAEAVRRLLEGQMTPRT